MQAYYNYNKIIFEINHFISRKQENDRHFNNLINIHESVAVFRHYINRRVKFIIVVNENRLSYIYILDQNEKLKLSERTSETEKPVFLV